ncbi:ABC transporter ATP-binding protein [Alteromonas sp. 14N.309.X.WAT.G.H12]|uniref:ABC transporter ATP-binding protein n=1 Tax=Alteromonas sp. 14N.309.X.WAT.G.H12 TaxID=3120824 RepID=UPI002FD4DB79
MDLLEVSNISVTFGRKKVFENFCYIFRPGVTLVTGQNGVGKSTLLSIVSTTTSPDEGEVNYQVGGIKKPFNIIKDGIFIPDKPDFYNFMTIREFYKLIKKIKKVSFDFYETEIFQEFSLKKHLDTPLRAISFGTKKKIFLLVALTVDSPVIILDEPTNGLDAESHEVLIKHLNMNRQSGHIIIMSSHDTNFTKNFNDELINL